MKKLPLIALILGALVIGFAAGVIDRSKSHISYNDTIVYRDTIVDTIKYRLPIPVESIVLKTVPTKLPVIDTIFINNERVLIDSVYVDIPIQQKEYFDSTYHAWVSGYNASLDSIHIYKHTLRTINTVRNTQKKWGLGIQVGAGYNEGKISPYVGIGINYNIVAW